MIENRCMENKISIRSLKKWISYKIHFNETNPDYFYPCGMVVFTGPQGSGKTLSAVLYVENLMKQYDNAILVTNVFLMNYPVDNERVFWFSDNDDFKKYNNDQKGVIYFIDEIQLYLNSLQSKNINLEVVTEISQQRKQRKHIVCTSQVFGRMAKPLREQFSEIVACKNVLGFLQKNSLIDRDSIESDGEATGTNITGKVKSKYWFVHDPLYYELYDTYQKIEKGAFRSNEDKGGEIYDG